VLQNQLNVFQAIELLSSNNIVVTVYRVDAEKKKIDVYCSVSQHDKALMKISPIVLVTRRKRSGGGLRFI